MKSAQTFSIRETTDPLGGTLKEYFIDRYGTTMSLVDRYGSTMTPNQVAAELHQSPTHIRAMCQTGELPAVRIGKRWHIATAKFAAMLEGQNE